MLHGFVEVLWREAAAPDVLKRGLVGSDHARPCSGLDAHIAYGHATFHAEGANGLSAVLDYVSRRSVGSDPSDDSECDIFGRSAQRQLSIDNNLHGFRLFLP